MEYIIIPLIILFLIAAVLIISYVCFKMAFYQSDRTGDNPENIIFPEGEIYGIYRSAALATDLYYQLLEIGVQASFVSDVLTCATSALMLGEKDLVIAISSSGQTKDVIDAVKIAKEKGVSVICLTGNRNSPLAKLSDVVLVAAASGNSVFSNAKEIRFSQLAVLDALCSFVAGKIDDEEKRYSIVNKILNSHSVKD